MAISNPGGNLNSVPSSQQQTLSTNYLDLASTAGQGWAQQYLPDLMEKEAEVFGPRTISGLRESRGCLGSYPGFFIAPPWTWSFASLSYKVLL